MLCFWVFWLPTKPSFLYFPASEQQTTTFPAVKNPPCGVFLRPGAAIWGCCHRGTGNWGTTRTHWGRWDESNCTCGWPCTGRIGCHANGYLVWVVGVERWVARFFIALLIKLWYEEHIFGWICEFGWDLHVARWVLGVLMFEFGKEGWEDQEATYSLDDLKPVKIDSDDPEMWKRSLPTWILLKSKWSGLPNNSRFNKRFVINWVLLSHRNPWSRPQLVPNHGGFLRTTNINCIMGDGHCFFSIIHPSCTLQRLWVIDCFSWKLKVNLCYLEHVVYRTSRD